MRIDPSMTNGRLAMTIVSHVADTIDGQATLDSFCNAATTDIQNACIASHADMAQLTDTPSLRPTCSAVVYSAFHNEIWMIGDCQAMVDGIAYDNEKPHEALLAQKRSDVINSMLSEGDIDKAIFQTKDDPGRASIINEIISACKDQNKTYAVLDGFCVYMDGVRRIKLSEGAHEIVLASDGYPHLRPTLALSEAALRQQIEQDPLCIDTHKATKGLLTGNKSFDDRSFIRFTVE